MAPARFCPDLSVRGFAHPQITDMEALVAEMFEQWDQAGGQILIQQEFQAATVTVAWSTSMAA